MSHPPDLSDHLLASQLHVSQRDRSDIYPTVILYGCGCWSLVALTSFIAWLLW